MIKAVYHETARKLTSFF